MKLTDYSNLKEIHSLDNMIKVHLDTIKEEEGRIEFITNKRKQKDQELEDLQNNKKILENEISDTEVTLFDLEKRVSSAQGHLPMATSEKEANALQNEVDSLSPKIDELQEFTLEKLEEVEKIELDILQAQNFLKGSQETLQEITEEVQKVVQEQQLPIHQYSERIDLLIEDIPKPLYTQFGKIREKFRYNKPMVRIINHACEYCHFRVDQMTLERVESLQGIECCGQCGRLFIPLEA